MRVISRPPLKAFAKDHPNVASAIEDWYTNVRRSEWTSFASLRRTFPSADLYEKCVIFNIGGNKVRVIATIHYQKTNEDGEVVEGRVYVRNVLTHAEYDKEGWKEGCEC